MYLCKFDSTGKRISTLLEGVHYKTDAEKAAYMSDGYVEISDEDYAYYAGNHGTGDHGTGYVRGSDGKPLSAPVHVQTATDRADTITAAHATTVSALKEAYATAMLAGDTSTAASIQADYVTDQETMKKELQEVQ
jgi:hypothetical protein